MSFSGFRIQLCCIILIAIFGIALCSDEKQERVFYNPIIEGPGGADPAVLKHGGFYYLVFTEGNKITVHQSEVFTNFRNGQRRTVYTAPQGRTNLWAPEMHFVRQNLYIYFTMQDGPLDEHHRMYVIRADNPNDPLGNWSGETRLLPEEDRYAIDGTVLQYGDGALYFIWTGFPEPPGSMNLYIAPMSDPMRVIPPRRLLRFPKSPWEMHGYPVNEGPYVIQNAGRTFVVFSGSSTFTPEYCLGIFGIDGLRDPLVASNWWNDKDECVFWRNDAEGVFTTGHASFTPSPDGTELWMIYHATSTANANGVNRTARAQKLEWNPDNAPRFPRPIGLGNPVPLPSGQRSADAL